MAPSGHRARTAQPDGMKQLAGTTARRCAMLEFYGRGVRAGHVKAIQAGDDADVVDALDPSTTGADSEVTAHPDRTLRRASP